MKLLVPVAFGLIFISSAFATVTYSFNDTFYPFGPDPNLPAGHAELTITAPDYLLSGTGLLMNGANPGGLTASCGLTDPDDPALICRGGALRISTNPTDIGLELYIGHAAFNDFYLDPTWPTFSNVNLTQPGNYTYSNPGTLETATLAVTAIPEPGSAGSLAFAGVAITALILRRRKKSTSRT